jgi:hypothetical protein
LAKQIKELRAKVEDVSHRNVLINSSANSRHITGGSSAADATMFGVNSIKPSHWWPNLPKTTTFGLRDKKPPHLSWFFAEHPNDEFAAN